MSSSKAVKTRNNCFVDAVIRTWPKLLLPGGDDLALSIQDLGTWVYFLTLGSRNNICPSLSFCPSEFQAFAADKNLHSWRIQQACTPGKQRSIMYACPGPLAAQPGLLLSTRETEVPQGSPLQALRSPAPRFGKPKFPVLTDCSSAWTAAHQNRSSMTCWSLIDGLSAGVTSVPPPRLT